MRYTAGRVLRSLALLPFLFVSHATLAQEDAEIEEVVVTGSYLKKTTADSPSPLSVVTRANIEEIGAVDIKDIVNNLDKYKVLVLNNCTEMTKVFDEKQRRKRRRMRRKARILPPWRPTTKTKSLLQRPTRARRKRRARKSLQRK